MPKLSVVYCLSIRSHTFTRSKQGHCVMSSVVSGHRQGSRRERLGGWALGTGRPALALRVHRSPRQTRALGMASTFSLGKVLWYTQVCLCCMFWPL